MTVEVVCILKILVFPITNNSQIHSIISTYTNNSINTLCGIFTKSTLLQNKIKNHEATLMTEVLMMAETDCKEISIIRISIM